MPSFFPTHIAFPPTPPHLNIGSRMEIDPPFYPNSHSAFPMRYSQNGCDFIEQYSQATYYSNHGSMNSLAQPLPSIRSGRDLGAKQSVLSRQAAPPAMYSSINVPTLLPPIRSSAKLPAMDSAIPPQYRQSQETIHQDQCPKEEKTTGGVAAHLDYEMEQMADFVAEMAQGIVYPGTPVPPQFRKYVSQILTSTRLPSSTILLGLYYLACRMRMLSAAEVYTTGSAQVYRMLTTALLLGSKFLDDNTFQNRSWAEVSNIPVSELNAMELDWLFGFEWKIHDRVYNKQDGFMTWKVHWETWRSKAGLKANESRNKLTPIDTNIQRHHVAHKVLLSPDGPIPPQYQRTAWLTPIASDYSPPSAPHSGPNTPDYYRSRSWAYLNPPPPYSRVWVAQQYVPPVPRSQPPSYHHTPSYAQTFSPTVWTGHGSPCGCLHCANHQEHYLPAAGFGLQPVVG